MKELCKIVAAGLIGMTLLAEDAPKPSAPSLISSVKETSPTAGINNFNKASSVIGMSVTDSGGKALGKVQDLVFDLESSKLAYAVLALTENRIVPVPISALKRVQSGDHFVLNMSPSLLVAAPGIQNDDWPAVDAFAVGAPAQSEIGQGKSSDKKSQ